MFTSIGSIKIHLFARTLTRIHGMSKISPVDEETGMEIEWVCSMLHPTCFTFKLKDHVEQWR